MVTLFFIMLIIGAPLVFAFAFSSFVYIWTTPSMTGQNVSSVFFSALDSFPLMAIPLFIFAGDLMVQGGISRKIIDFIKSIVGNVKGYLGSITIIACAFFSAISGSGVATVAAVGSMMIPEMEKANYPKGYPAALTASAAFLGIIIPPSIPMIMYGFLSNTSVAALFVAGIVPGVILALTFLIIHYFMMKNREIENEESNESDTVTTKLDYKEKYLKIWHTGRVAVLALLMPIIVIGGIYGGIFTPTESAVVAVFYAIFVSSVFYRKLSFKSFFLVTKKSTLNTSMLMITLVFATVFSRILTLEKVPQSLANLIIGISSETWVLLLIIILFLLLVGMVMDAITGVILVTPILYPIAVTELGLDPVHFGIIVIVTLAVGLITPPMAINVFLAAQISGTSVKQTFARVVPFLAMSLIVILIITYFPIVSTGLVKFLS